MVGVARDDEPRAAAANRGLILDLFVGPPPTTTPPRQSDLGKPVYLLGSGTRASNRAPNPPLHKG